MESTLRAHCTGSIWSIPLLWRCSHCSHEPFLLAVHSTKESPSWNKLHFILEFLIPHFCCMEPTSAVKNHFSFYSNHSISIRSNRAENVWTSDFAIDPGVWITVSVSNTMFFGEINMLMLAYVLMCTLSDSNTEQIIIGKLCRSIVKL